MTVQTTLDRQYFDGDGANKNFPFNFKFFQNSEIFVFLIDPSLVVTPQSLTTDYTLTGAGKADGGQVTFITSPPDNWQVLIRRILPETQLVSLRNQAAFFASIHEDAFDRLTMLIQQALSGLGSSIQLDASATSWDFKNKRGVNVADPVNARDIVNLQYLLALIDQISIPDIQQAALDLKANLADLANAADYSKGVSLVAGSVRTVNNIASMRLLTPAQMAGTRTVHTRGYYNAGDGGHGVYDYFPTDTTSPDNGCTIIQAAGGARLKLRHNGEINVLQGGADPSGGTDSTGTFNITRAAALLAGVNQIRIPFAGAGTYFINSATGPAVWILDRGVIIAGLPNVGSAGGGTPDLSRLTGAVLSNSVGGSNAQWSKWIGAGKDFMAPYRDPASFLAEHVVVSRTGGYGIIGMSRASDNPTPNMNCIGVGAMVLNDNIAAPEAAWSSYKEAVRLNGAGATFNVESDFQNYGATLDLDPYSTDDPYSANGPTAHYWASCGGGKGSGVQDISAALVTLFNGARMRRGIVFKQNSITTLDAVAMPYDYRATWFTANLQSSGYLDGKTHARTRRSDTLNDCVTDSSYKKKANGTSQTNTSDIAWRNDAYLYNGGDYLAGSVVLVQRTEFSGANARTSLNLSARNSDGGTTTLQVNGAGDACFSPTVDNVITLGSPALRMSILYSGTGTINTSDAREKTEVRGLSPEEIGAAKALSKEIGAYQFLSAVSQKGESARLHIGMTVQRCIEVMDSFGLDALQYGFVCHDSWDAIPEEKDEDGNVIQPGLVAGDRYGFRMDELLAFVAAGLNARLSAIEDKD